VSAGSRMQQFGCWHGGAPCWCRLWGTPVRAALPNRLRLVTTLARNLRPHWPWPAGRGEGAGRGEAEVNCFARVATRCSRSQFHGTPDCQDPVDCENQLNQKQPPSKCPSNRVALRSVRTSTDGHYTQCAAGLDKKSSSGMPWLPTSSCRCGLNCRANASIPGSVFFPPTTLYLQPHEMFALAQQRRVVHPGQQQDVPRNRGFDQRVHNVTPPALWFGNQRRLPGSRTLEHELVKVPPESRVHFGA
jgi:hypothetical protein